MDQIKPNEHIMMWSFGRVDFLLEHAATTCLYVQVMV